MANKAGTPGTCVATGDVGWYVYAIVPRGAEVAVTAGIGGSPTVFISEGPIRAVAAPVSLAVFDSEPLRRHMEDPSWLEEAVRQHEAIVEAVMAAHPVLPMRFCTIFRAPEAVRSMLREHAIQFCEALEFVKDKEEWGIKGFADRGSLRRAILREDPEVRDIAEQMSKSAPGSPGRTYLLKRRQEEVVEQRRLEREAELIRATATALQDSVVQLANLPSLQIQGAGAESVVCSSGGRPEEKMVLNLACLVLREAVQPLLAEIQRWNETAEDQGFRLVASGPWPSYNFSPRFGNDAG